MTTLRLEQLEQLCCTHPMIRETQKVIFNLFAMTTSELESEQLGSMNQILFSYI